MAVGEVREIIRRALLVALGLFLALVALAGAFVAVHDALSVAWWAVVCSVVAFFLGRALINWIFRKS
jgi:hypothetical protein